MIRTDHIRINAGGTIAIIDRSIALKQLVITVSDAGTTWKIRLEDNDTPPAILVPAITVSLPSTLSWIYQNFEIPLPMIDGLDFVTESGTPGVMDIWYSYWQPSH